MYIVVLSLHTKSGQPKYGLRGRPPRLEIIDMAVHIYSLLETVLPQVEVANSYKDNIKVPVGKKHQCMPAAIVTLTESCVRA